jgi:hypothetical protein
VGGYIDEVRTRKERNPNAEDVEMIVYDISFSSEGNSGVKVLNY